jgi:hypothetical protein
MEGVIQRFNKIHWHDSKLVGLSLSSSGPEEQVKVSLELLGEGDSISPAEIVFRDCAYFQADVYLHAKRQCSDDIAGAECYASSEWKAAVSKPGPYDPVQGGRGLDGYLHFEIYLCSPGGTINILARDFVLASAANLAHGLAR